MRVAQLPVPSTALPRSSTVNMAAAVRAIAPVRPLLPAEDNGGSSGVSQAVREEPPAPDYRPLLEAALQAGRAEGTPVPVVEEGGAGQGEAVPADEGSSPDAGAAAPRSPARWRWNTRYDGETLASLYARMSGELVTVGTRVDAFA